MATSEPGPETSTRVRLCQSFLADVGLAEYRSNHPDDGSSDSLAAVLEENSRPLAFVRFFEDFGKTLAILDFGSVVERPIEQHASAIRALLHALISEARQRHCRWIRILSPADPRLLKQGSSSWPLQELEFSLCATVSRWRPVDARVTQLRSVQSKRRDAATPIRLDAVDISISDSDTSRVVQMVNRISQDSNDLIRLPKPNGGELAESWRRKRSHTVIATADGQDAGVVAWSTTGMPGVAEVTIEYLGIAPDCRRRGIGRHLILHALSHIQSMSRDQILDVSVMIDNSNSAAVQLYHRCGFRRTPVSFDVWLLEVGGT